MPYKSYTKSEEKFSPYSIQPLDVIMYCQLIFGKRVGLFVGGFPPLEPDRVVKIEQK